MSTSLGGSLGFGATGRPTKVGNTGYESVISQQFTPEQMNLFKSLFSGVGPDSYLSKLAGGDQDTFNQIESPALQQFSGLQGNLASRFSGMGSTGARRSSGFQNAANMQASDFARQLQSQRQSLQQNAIQQLHSMSQDLLGQRPYEENYFQNQDKPKSRLEQFLSSIIPLAGAGLGGAFGGVGGAAIGGNIGSQFSQAFS